MFLVAGISATLAVMSEEGASQQDMVAYVGVCVCTGEGDDQKKVSRVKYVVQE